MWKWHGHLKSARTAWTLCEAHLKVPFRKVEMEEPSPAEVLSFLLWEGREIETSRDPEHACLDGEFGSL